MDVHSDMHAKVKAFTLTAVIFAVITASLTAQTKKTAAAQTKDSTLAGEWFLKPVLASDMATGKIPRIILDPVKGSFSGNTGCNSMRGTFALRDSALAFNEQIITTKMACVGYDEAVFIKNLLRINGYRLSKKRLVFLVDGNELFIWTRKIQKPVKTAKA